MNQREMFREVSNSVNVIWHGGWCVMSPWDNTNIHGPTTASNHVCHFAAVQHAKGVRIRLAVIKMIDLDEEEYARIGHEIAHYGAYPGKDWRQCARDIVASYKRAGY